MITRYHVPAPPYKLQVKWQMEPCLHNNMEIAVMTLSNGQKRYCDQCADCGWESGQLANSKLTQAQMDSAVPKIESTEKQRMWQKRYDAFKQQVEENEYIAQARWWGWYNEYLKSPVWQAKRAKVFARAHNVCEACGDAPAYQVHHLTYKNVGKEPLFDLVAVCAECHRALHEEQRNDQHRP